MTIQVKDSEQLNEQYFPVVLFMMLNTVVPTFEILTFETLDETLKCDHPYKLLSCNFLYM